MVEKISAERLPELWDNFTGKRVLWEDRERVRENNPKAWNAWIQAINQYRSKIGSDLKTRRVDAIQDYEYQMGKLDTRIKTARANFVNARKEKLRQIEKAPQYRINSVGELTLHELDEASDKWVDTGKKKAAPEKPQLIYDTKLEKSVYITPSQMRKDLKEDPYRYGEKPKEEEEEKPEYKAGQALEKIATAQRAKATFNKTGKIDAIIAKMFPEYTEGQKLSKPEIRKVNKTYDRLIKYLEEFAPQLSKREQAIEQLQAAGQQVTEANIKYVMDQL